MLFKTWYLTKHLKACRYGGSCLFIVNHGFCLANRIGNLQILKGAQSAKSASMPKRSCKSLAKFILRSYEMGNQDVANLVMKTEFRDVLDGGRYRCWHLPRDFRSALRKLIFRRMVGPSRRFSNSGAQKSSFWALNYITTPHSPGRYRVYWKFSAIGRELCRAAWWADHNVRLSREAEIWRRRRWIL